MSTILSRNALQNHNTGEVPMARAAKKARTGSAIIAAAFLLTTASGEAFAEETPPAQGSTEAVQKPAAKGQ
jgi:hypothetical protein